MSLSFVVLMFVSIALVVLAGWALSAAFLAQAEGFFSNEGYRWGSFLLACGIFIKIIPDEYPLRDAISYFLSGVLVFSIVRYLFKKNAE